MALAPGTRLGPYEISAQIGVGGMGVVYRARDSKLARDVAIKTLSPRIASEPNRWTRFRREARALAKLNHPNIAAIYGLEESADGYYLVLELVEGETLADRLSRTGPISTEEVLRIAIRMAEALEAAHAKDITHRDVKPSNIKLTPEGRVKILDFGLAKSSQDRVYDETSTSTTLHTEPGVIVGTPPYMSPEQIRGQVTDQRTDVWAFGCVVYELLTGRPPFRGSTVPDVIASILQGEPDWQGLPAGVPEDVRTLLRRCLEKDASQRWQGFQGLRGELARAISAPVHHERSRRWIVSLFGAVPIALAALLALGPVPFRSLDNAVYDTILRWSTTPRPDPRVAIVEIDDRSLATIGQWPWRRDVIGRLIARLRDLGATTIAIDLVFPELDRYQGLVQDADASNQAQRGTPDELLAQSLRRGRVVLGYAMTFGPDGPAANDCELHPLNLSIPHPRGMTSSQAKPFFEATGSVCTLKSLAVAAGQSGFLNGVPDADGILRRMPLVIGLNGRVYPSLAVAAVSVASASRGGSLRVSNENHVFLTLGQRTVPLDGRSNLMLRYRGPRRSFPYISAADVLEERPFEAIKDKIVFVGATATGSHDTAPTPLDMSFVGVEVQATVADNLLQLDFIYRPVSARKFESLAVSGLGGVVILLVGIVGLSAGAVVGLVGLVALWVGSVWLLSTSGVFLSPLYSTVGVALAFMSMALAKLGVERRRAETAMRKVESAVLDGGSR